MGNVNAIPVISQAKSLVQVIGGDAKGAKETQTRSAVEATYDTDASRRTQKEFLKNMENVVDGTPLVGHIKGGVHYALNDNEKGDACMKSASRTTAAIAAGVATGGAGAVAAGVAAATAGVVTDAVTTGVDSAVHNEYRPNGFIQAVSTSI